MSINHSGRPPASVSNVWQEILTTRSRSVQELAGLKVDEIQVARVHALLSATDSNGGASQTANGSRIVVDIGGRLVELTANIKVQPGDLLELSLRANGELQVKAGGTPITLASALRFLPADALLNLSRPSPGTTSGLLHQPSLQDALNKVLPFQGRLLDTLSRLLQLPTSESTPDLQARIQQLRALIPNAQDLATPAGLKQALQQSGAFAEKQLLSDASQVSHLLRQPGSPDGPRDLKLLLLSLFATLGRSPQGTAGSEKHPQATGASPLSPRWQPASNYMPQPLLFPHPEFLKSSAKDQQQKVEFSTGELLKLVAQALSRIQTTQLNSIQQFQSGVEPSLINSWLIELPVWSGQQLNLFQVRMEEHRQREDASGNSERKQESIWRITLSFNLEPLGPMYSLVRIQQGKVSSTFWAETDSTLKLLEQELPNLHKALGKLGLEVEFLEAMQGQPSFTQTRLDTQLIDVRT